MNWRAGRARARLQLAEQLRLGLGVAEQQAQRERRVREEHGEQPPHLLRPRHLRRPQRRAWAPACLLQPTPAHAGARHCPDHTSSSSQAARASCARAHVSNCTFSSVRLGTGGGADTAAAGSCPRWTGLPCAARPLQTRWQRARGAGQGRRARRAAARAAT